MKYVYFSLLTFFFFSCGGDESTTEQDSPDEPVTSGLPYIGMHDNVLNDAGEMEQVYHTVPPFILIDQDSNTFNNASVEGKIHVVNFFFTHCPGICPAMIAQMKRLQKATTDIEELHFLSHTIDPKRDSIPRLNWYIEDKEIDTKNWSFLYGEKASVYELGEDGYMLNAMEDEEAEGGFLHSEHFVLVDREGHVRGLYVGTDTEQVDQLEKDIRKLLATEYAN